MQENIGNKSKNGPCPIGEWASYQTRLFWRLTRRHNGKAQLTLSFPAVKGLAESKTSHATAKLEPWAVGQGCATNINPAYSHFGILNQPEAMG